MMFKASSFTDGRKIFITTIFHACAPSSLSNKDFCTGLEIKHTYIIDSAIQKLSIQLYPECLQVIP